MVRGRRPTAFLFAWLAGLIVVLAITFGARRSSTTFYGIAETREIVVNSEKPVELAQISVVPGQTIRKGDLLVLLSRSELDKEIIQKTHQLEELKARRSAGGKGRQTQINQLKARKQATVNEIDGKIEELTAKYKFNKELLSGLRSVDTAFPASEDSSPGPLAREIERLEKERTLAIEQIDMRIESLQRELYAADAPVNVQIEQLQGDLALLKEERTKLRVVAQIDGVVGSVNFKEGEKVSPFTPILTLHTRAPSYVRGYIHENAANAVNEGHAVVITSLASRSTKCNGEVVGVGSRIVEYPRRLRKRPDIQVWGREITVLLPDENPFLLGEKVRLHVIGPSPLAGPGVEPSVPVETAAPFRAGESTRE